MQEKTLEVALGRHPVKKGGVRLLNWLVLRPRLAWGLGRAHGLQAARAPGCRQYFFKNLVFIVVKYTEHKIFHLNNFQVHSSAALSTLTLLCDQHHHPSPRCFHRL